MLYENTLQKFSRNFISTPSKRKQTMQATAPPFTLPKLASRDITTFPFPPSLKHKIVSAGFKDSRDFNGMRPVELAKGSPIF